MGDSVSHSHYTQYETSTQEQPQTSTLSQPKQQDLTFSIFSIPPKGTISSESLLNIDCLYIELCSSSCLYITTIR